MSVMVLDPKVFEYINNGLTKTALNTVVDEFYSYRVGQFFRDKGLDQVYQIAADLVKKWADLNERSYDEAYNEEPNEQKLSEFINVNTLHKVEPIQLLKYVECLLYNIEVEKTPLHPAIELLENWRQDLMSAIIHSTKAYNDAKWSNI